MEETKKEGSRLFTVINILLCIILIPVILINAAVIVSSYIHPDEIPGIFGIKPVAVLSGSMESTFMAGDLIFVKKTSTDSLKEGDVICYLVSDQAVTHRISAIQQDEDGSDIYITKGDANNTEDQDTVKPEQVQGVWTGGRLGGHGEFCYVSVQHHRHDCIYFLPNPAADCLGYHTTLEDRQKRESKGRSAGGRTKCPEGITERAKGYR